MQRHSVTVPIMINTLQSRPCEVDERSMLECGRLMMKPARAFEIHQPYLPLQTDSLRSLYTLPPPLKWAGGKRWQLPHLRKLWEGESHRRLVEPFCGGLAVTVDLLPERALLNDVNPLPNNLQYSLKLRLNY